MSESKSTIEPPKSRGRTLGSFFKEPLLHFLLIGAGLFWLYSRVNPEVASASDNTIVVSAGRIEQLVRVFEKTWQRPPSAAELKGLIDDFIIEEMYYRRAVAMGLDRDDTLIRRRMRQKVEFLTDDTAALMEPDDEALSAYLAAHEERFRKDSLYTFRQIYFNPERHGDHPETYVEQQLASLRSGGQAAGDSTLIPEIFHESPGRVVDSTFGTGFTKKLNAVTLKEWSEPVRSGLGIHLILLESRVPGTVPPLAEVRSQVEREWANEKRLELRREVNKKLLGQYEIVIEWPESERETQAQASGAGS